MVRRLFLSLLMILTATFDEADAQLILLLSDDKPSITGVAKAIEKEYSGKVELYNLDGDTNKISSIVEKINSSAEQVVAIGLLAAQVARQRLPHKQTIFCQILNYENFDLVSPRIKGVSAIPSLIHQFEIWKLLDPSLNKVGVITSKSMMDLVMAAKIAAAKFNIEIVHAFASSDRELPHLLKQLGDIQGLWLAPDSAVLSMDALDAIMTQAIKRHIQVLSFAPALLKQGALLSATPNEQEVAQAVLLRLKQAEGQPEIPGPAIVQLKSATITVNEKAMEQFDLIQSDDLRELLYGHQKQ